MADPKTGELANPEDFEVPQDPNAPAPVKQATGYVKTPRDIAMEEMARRAHLRRLKADKEFTVDVLNDDGTITPAAAAAAPAETAEPAEPEADIPTNAPDTRDSAQITAAEANNLQQEASDPLPSVAPVPPTSPEEERELIVDGKRIKVPLSKILDAGTRTLQKEVTADMRLAAATELLRSAQERQAQPAAPATPAQQTTQPSDDDAALARAIQFGTEEEAKAAIARIRNAAPAITPQQIDAYVQQKLTQVLPEHAAFNEANAWLRTEHKQITDDPDLKFLFDTKEEQARRAGDRRPYKELYAAIAGELSTKFNLKRAEPTPAQQQAVTTPASDRLTRKAQSPRPITGASGRLEQPQAPQRAPTVAEYVTRQRQLRGLQPLSKGQGI